MPADKTIVEKLDSLTAIPGGTSLDVRKAWNQLEHTLPSTRNRNYTALKYAAFVLLIGGASTIAFVASGPALVSVDQVEHGTELKPAMNITENKTESTTFGMPQPLQSIDLKPKETRKKVTPPVATVETVRQAIDTIAVIPAPETQTTIATVPPAPPKKLRVVHLNEMGKLEMETKQTIGANKTDLIDPKPGKRFFPTLELQKRPPLLSQENN